MIKTLLSAFNWCFKSIVYLTESKFLQTGNTASEHVFRKSLQIVNFAVTLFFQPSWWQNIEQPIKLQKVDLIPSQPAGGKFNRKMANIKALWRPNKLTSPGSNRWGKQWSGKQWKKRERRAQPRHHWDWACTASVHVAHKCRH